MSPIATATLNATATACTDTEAGHAVCLIKNVVIAHAEPNPIPPPMNIPISPPDTLKTVASIRNCCKISICRAPTAFRNPISLVRSVTDTSIMFIMPMPPTNNAILATPPSKA